MVRKTNFLSFSVLVSEIVIFMSKKKSSLLISSKILQNHTKYSFAVCGLLCGEKQFLLTFIHFYWFDQKQLLIQIQIFLQDFPLFKHGKKNKLSDYFSACFYEIVTFMSKKKSSLWISPKMLQNNRKA